MKIRSGGDQRPPGPSPPLSPPLLPPSSHNPLSGGGGMMGRAGGEGRGGKGGKEHWVGEGREARGEEHWEGEGRGVHCGGKRGILGRGGEGGEKHGVGEREERGEGRREREALHQLDRSIEYQPRITGVSRSFCRCLMDGSDG